MRVCNIELSCRMADGRYFCRDGHRGISADSYNTDISCVSDERAVGKIVFRIRSLSGFGKLKREGGIAKMKQGFVNNVKDSRGADIGYVSDEQIAGESFFRACSLSGFSKVEIGRRE